MNRHPYAKRYLYEGKMRTVPEIAKIAGIRPETLRYRLKRLKYDVHKALKPMERDYSLGTLNEGNEEWRRLGKKRGMSPAQVEKYLQSL